MKYAFTNAEGTVVNCISGTLSAAQQEQFLRDYAILFGATQIIEVEDGTSVWVGGTYTGEEFQAPPTPEPLPAPEPLPEPLPEPQPEPEI